VRDGVAKLDELTERLHAGHAKGLQKDVIKRIETDISNLKTDMLNHAVDAMLGIGSCFVRLTEALEAIADNTTPAAK
jgi:hypothetical protein